MNTTFEIERTYNELLPELKSFIYRLTCDKEVTNDLAQNTFVKVIESQRQFKGASSVKTWIFSIESNLSIDWLRKKKRWAENAQDEAKKLSETDNFYREKYIHINLTAPAGYFDFIEHINLTRLHCTFASTTFATPIYYLSSSAPPSERMELIH